MSKASKIVASLMSAAVLGLMAAGAQAATEFRFGHEAARSDTQQLASVKFNELLKAKTNGELGLKIFPESTLGNAQALITGVRGGTIDVELSGSNNFTGLEGVLNVLDVPFMFKDEAHAYRVLDGKVGEQLLVTLEKHNLKGLAFWDNGFRMVTNSRAPVNSPADLKGLKIRTTGSPVHIEAFKLMGANPLPMPLSELYTALETKTVEAQEHPLGILWSAKLYEVQKYLSLTRHAYSPLILVMNKTKFDALPAAQQKAIVDAAREAGQYQRTLNKENVQTILLGVKKAGMQVVEKVDPTPFLAITKPVRENFVAKFGGADIIKQIDAVRDAK